MQTANRRVAATAATELPALVAPRLNSNHIVVQLLNRTTWCRSPIAKTELSENVITPATNQTGTGYWTAC